MAFLKKQPRKFIFTAFSVDGNRDRIDRNLGPVLQWAGARGSSPSAGMAELADALDLGSSAARRGGSSPLVRTKIGTGAAKSGVFDLHFGAGCARLAL